MEFVWRPLAPREFDPELVWLCISLGGLAAAAVWMALGLTWPICIFHALTGHPCLTCGATRSAVAFFHGDLPSALTWNPLMFVAYVGIALFDVYAFVVVVLRRPRLRVTGLSVVQKNCARWGLLAAMAAN